MMAEARRDSGGKKVEIIADHREKGTKTFQWLKTFDAEIREEQLDVADYIVSEHIGIERKTVDDFLASFFDQRLFGQLGKMAASFEKPLLIIEGEPEMLFGSRKVHPNSIHGVLSSIALDHRIPIIWTHSPRMTAAQIYWIAYREQVKKSDRLQARVCKKNRSAGDHQEFIVAGLPNVNSRLSRRLLKEFGTVRKVFSAKDERLLKVEGIGKKKANAIWCILNQKYEDDE
jgi:ERCC4-type nuclease